MRSRRNHTPWELRSGRADEDLDTSDEELAGRVEHGGMGEGMRSPRYSGRKHRHAGTGEANRANEELGIIEPKGVPGTDDYRGPERETPPRRRRPDAEILDEIHFELQKDARLLRFPIEVDCQDGRVIVSGTVETPEDIEHAIELCRTVPNVVDVVSKLELGAGGDGEPPEPVRTT